MIFDSFGFTDVVQEQDEVEEMGVVVFAEFLFVVDVFRLSIEENIVEVLDRAEDVHVCRVAVVVLVLYHASELAKLGKIAAQNANLMHGEENGIDLSGFTKDGEKALGRSGAVD